MQRFFTSILWSFCLCAAFACSGVAADPAAVSAGVAADTPDSAESPDTASAETTVADSAPGAPDKGDAATGDTGATAADVPSPCGGPCKAPEKCNSSTKKCEVFPIDGCQPACQAGKYCELKATPVTCKTMGCAYPKTWGPAMQKVSKLYLPYKDATGAVVGCDLDEDGKPNNMFAAALASFLKQANDQLAKAVNEGSLVLVLESGDFQADGSAFGINILIGDLDKSNKSCDAVSPTAQCKYTIRPASYDATVSAATCPSVNHFPNMTVKDGKASRGGGNNETFVLSLPIQGFTLPLKIHQARLQGEFAGAKTWDSTKKGLICGTVAKADLDGAGFVGSLLKLDIDGDGDGIKESSSVAIEFESVGAAIIGLSAAQ